jgi:hypothetical protein
MHVLKGKQLQKNQGQPREKRMGGRGGREGHKSQKKCMSEGGKKMLLHCIYAPSKQAARSSQINAVSQYQDILQVLRHHAR